MGLVESQGPMPSFRDKVGLGLFMGLRPMRKHVIMHRDECSLSSLKERGTLDFQGQRFSYKRTFMENPNPNRSI